MRGCQQARSSSRSELEGFRCSVLVAQVAWEEEESATWVCPSGSWWEVGDEGGAEGAGSMLSDPRESELLKWGILTDEDSGASPSWIPDIRLSSDSPVIWKDIWLPSSILPIGLGLLDTGGVTIWSFVNSFKGPGHWQTFCQLLSNWRHSSFTIWSQSPSNSTSKLRCFKGSRLIKI